ncbi:MULTISPECIES: LysR family transcriptional regulator [Komagataeibacter]|uniref:LysR family transcriptional regulator n=10 Tax=Komagataeibacter TaxID=1434011 RepID=A0A318QXN1_9PROT|nr:MULTISPECIES: LysR family transcriptional regulator [Komagataeibacter]MBV1829945.1 LysR family transcriptional regulator [Komagataeibacter melomenusus]GBR36359.1 LysR family transcriptional regulator [Komagataeibacter oboediens DSM 11826]AQU86685.1 LysR family transcriptional regulator [Komagataeibacter nataicola]KAB8124914.1 LysR family transcriptional regulator [Komagataeibacter medellinensis]KPH85288.1 LysR family transcriptional regulator [Komagataeibacter intermedius AF2]
MDWDKLRIFHAVAEAGSFTHAGDVLNLSQSAVSRQISALEEALQVPLFHRHARGLILTEQGETLNQTVREVFSKLAMTQSLLTESKEKAAGRLRVTTTTGFGTCWLTPRLHRFMETNPDISITLILEDNDLDLGMREADVAVRMHPPRQPDLIQRHLADFPLPIYASQSYLNDYGTPRTLEELNAHKLILFGGYHPPVPHINWLAETGVPSDERRQARLEVNSLAAMAGAIAAGIGIGSIPLYAASQYPNLVKILPEVPLPTVDAYFVYPEELRTSKRVAVFRDFLLAEINARH